MAKGQKKGKVFFYFCHDKSKAYQKNNEEGQTRKEKAKPLGPRRSLELMVSGTLQKNGRKLSRL